MQCKGSASSAVEEKSRVGKALGALSQSRKQGRKSVCEKRANGAHRSAGTDHSHSTAGHSSHCDTLANNSQLGRDEN
jgi:hypothetical protein